MTAHVHRVSVAAAVLLAHALAAAEETPQRVRGVEGRVAVYAMTNTVHEAVAWVPSETEFVVRGELSDEAVWLRVEPPEHVSVWVYRELVRNGMVLSDKVRVRAGAGLNFHPVGSLNKGERVEVRGTYGDWLKIKPPACVGFWVLRDQVEPLAVMPPEGVIAETETNAALVAVTGVATNPVVVPLSVPLLPPELKGYALSDAPDQGVRVHLTGLLDWGTVGAVAAPFCLIARQADGETLPVCHVLSPAAVANPLVGATVAVDGTRWRVKGSELPIVIAETVRAAE